MHKLFAAACLAAVLSIGGPFAQGASAQGAGTAPTAAAPSPNSARGGPRTSLPAGTKVNLNTAPASELDALPSVGKARLKAIMDERAKSPFKDWADFEKRMQHTSVNKGVRAKIQNLVTF